MHEKIKIILTSLTVAQINDKAFIGALSPS